MDREERRKKMFGKYYRENMPDPLEHRYLFSDEEYKQLHEEEPEQKTAAVVANDKASEKDDDFDDEDRVHHDGQLSDSGYFIMKKFFGF